MGNPFPQPGYPFGAAFAWIANASNIHPQTNPAYTKEMFQADFPQFTGLIDGPILDQFILMATNTVQEIRWHENWRYGMGLFIAHFATLYIQAMAGENPSAQQVISAAQARGLQASKSVGDVSVSYDFASIGSDLDGWAAWKLTQYGLQFATFARMLGKGGSYVW